MGDKSHLSNEQESYEYYLLHRSTESPTTTSSASSPMTAVMQNTSSTFNWQAISTFDPVVSQYYDYSQHHYPPQQAWSLPQPQQHQQHNMLFHQQQHHQLQQQLLHQQQHLSYRTPSLMQGSLYQQHLYQNECIHNDFIQFPPPPVVDVSYAQNYDMLHRPYDHSANIPIDTNNTSSEQQFMDMNKITKNNYAELSTSKMLEKPAAATKSGKVNFKSPSPTSSPIPSPVMSSSKRKRGRRASTSYQSSSMNHQHQQQGGDGVLLEEEQVEERRREKRTKQEEEEGGGGGYGGTGGVIVKGNQKTVDQLENELAFLRDECATILIMLDSLRNAFLADIPASSSSSSSRQSKSTLPLTGTINFMNESDNNNNNNNTSTFMINAKNSANEITSTPRRRSKIIAQNPEMEREIRIAYDDLMLQVRQLEKKVERLEGKSKIAYAVGGAVEEKKNTMVNRQEENEDNDDDQLSQQSSSNSTITVLSEEEKDDEEEDNDDYLKSRTKKKRTNSIASTNTNKTVKKKKNRC